MSQQIVDLNNLLESLIFKTLSELKNKGCSGFNIEVISEHVNKDKLFFTHSCHINKGENHNVTNYDHITFLLKQIINSINLTELPLEIKLRLIGKVFNIKYTEYVDNSITVFWYRSLELDYGFYYEKKS